MKKRVAWDDLKKGDEVVIVEAYTDAIFELRGTVTDRTETTLSLGNGEHLRVVAREDKERHALNIDKEMPDAPKTTGSVVKWYDPHFVRERAALLDEDGKWYDTAGMGDVDLEGKEWEVIFDAS